MKALMNASTVGDALDAGRLRVASAKRPQQQLPIFDLNAPAPAPALLCTSGASILGIDSLPTTRRSPVYWRRLKLVN